MLRKKISILRLLVFSITVFSLVSCGYKPITHASRNIFPDTVYVDVKIDKVEPENAPFVKDEMNRLIYTRLKGKVASKEAAESKITVSYGGSNFYPLAYKDGYVTRYRANVRVHFKVVSENVNFTKYISSKVESNIEASSLVSSALRTEAIKKGLEKAMDEFLAYLSVKTFLLKAKDKKIKESNANITL